MACRTDFTQASNQGTETNWLRPLSPRVTLISLITSSSSAVCRSILTSGIIVLSKTTPSVLEMLGGTWQIWIRHLYFPLTFGCRQGLIGFRELSLLLWIKSSHKRCSDPLARFVLSMDKKNLLCFTAPSWLFLLFAPKSTPVSSLWCSWGKTGCWVAFKAGWAGNEEPSPTDGPDPVLTLCTPLCLGPSHPHLFLRNGLLMVSWAQIWTDLHVLFLIPSCHHTCPFSCS